MFGVDQESHGRPKGARNIGRRPFFDPDNIRRLLSDPKNPAPLEWLLKEMWDERRPLEYRHECAKACLPYVHRKQPLAIDGGEDGQPIQLALESAPGLAMLSNEKLEQLMKLTAEIEGATDVSDATYTEARPGTGEASVQPPLDSRDQGGDGAQSKVEDPV